MPSAIPENIGKSLPRRRIPTPHPTPSINISHPLKRNPKTGTRDVPPPQKPQNPRIFIPHTPLRPPVFHIVVFYVLEAGEEAAAGCGALYLR